MVKQSLIFGNFRIPELANILADTYTLMISLAIIPDLFQNSIIVPIPKKATLDPNILANYRSIHIKLVEYSLMPKDNSSENQFGFRKDRGTSCAISLLNDTAAYTKKGALHYMYVVWMQRNDLTVSSTQGYSTN